MKDTFAPSADDLYAWRGPGLSGGLMTTSKLLASILLAIACNAQAAQQSVSGTQSFGTSLPGYGFAYSVSWDSAIGYELSTYSYAFYSGTDPLWTYGELSISLVLSPQASASFVGLTSLDLSAAASISFINLDTGAPELPPGFYSNTTRKLGKSWFSFYDTPGACTAPGGTVELRYSNPKCTFDANVVESHALSDGRLAATGDGSALLQIRAGNYLSPSDDPECASLSCMALNRDVIQRKVVVFSAGSTVGAVPEPSTAAMLGLGGMLIAFMAKRRRLL